MGWLFMYCPGRRKHTRADEPYGRYVLWCTFDDHIGRSLWHAAENHWYFSQLQDRWQGRGSPQWSLQIHVGHPWLDPPGADALKKSYCLQPASHVLEMSAMYLERRWTKPRKDYKGEYFFHGFTLRQSYQYVIQLLPWLRYIHGIDPSIQQPCFYIPARCSLSVFRCLVNPRTQLSFWILVRPTSYLSGYCTSMANIPQGSS